MTRLSVKPSQGMPYLHGFMPIAGLGYEPFGCGYQENPSAPAVAAGLEGGLQLGFDCRPVRVAILTGRISQENYRPAEGWQ